MDSVTEIKARLPIEDLVGQYCQLQKKGRTMVCLCPFHNDTKPSMNVSPDKGIAYCFACNSGGDIFSFYQKIEGVDFPQALKDLAEKTGVKLENAPKQTIKKDEKERLRECLESALEFYRDAGNGSETAKNYIASRKVPKELIKEFQLGYAPDSFSDTYQHLLKAGFSKKEILGTGLAIQKDLSDEKIYDRFRNRLMIPINDHQGGIIGFGGRTLGDDDAKYINSPEGPLYNKSTVLFGLDKAKDTIRETKKVILVEGYFDVIACHRIGIRNVVAVSGTALTEQHVKLLKRHAETVILCLDQDRAGQEAAERSFMLCSNQELPVHVVQLQQKDPDEAAQSDPDLLKQLLSDGGIPYLDHRIEQWKAGDTTSADAKRMILQQMQELYQALKSSVEKEHYLSAFAAVLGSTETALKEDLQKPRSFTPRVVDNQPEEKRNIHQFSAAEISLGQLLLFPTLHHLIDELIEPDDGIAKALYKGLKEQSGSEEIDIDTLDAAQEEKEHIRILQLFCEHHDFPQWSESIALREIRHNIALANNDTIKRKQKSIVDQMRAAHSSGNTVEAQKLQIELQQVMALRKRVKV